VNSINNSALDSKFTKTLYYFSKTQVDTNYAEIQSSMGDSMGRIAIEVENRILSAIRNK
jgi:hypothetical protein